MFRAGTFWRSLNKTFFASFAASTLLLLYLFFSVNFCVITNFRQVIQKKVETKVILEVPKSVTEGWVDKQETIVRLVPLIAWPMIEQKKGKPNYYSAKNQSTNGAPKYRFLRQQGLRPSRHLPDALIIGVKKSGTRALLEFIRLHPDVRAAGSEVHFFDRYYGKGFQWYRKHMPPTLEGQVTMEKTPSYFVTREAPSRVKQMNPSTRLLVVVRDPVTRAISDYTQAASKKSDAEMKRFEDLAFVNGSVWGSVNTSWGPIRIGVYTRHLERWLRHFPLHQMLFVSGERLIVDPAAEMARVQDFLGLKRVVTEKHFYFNATKGFPCLMKSEGRATPHCLGKTKGRNHPRIRPAALDRLREFYRPFNLRFYQLTDHEQSYNMDESMNSTLQETVERETVYVLVVGDDDMCGWLDQGVQIKEEHSYFDESSLNVKAPDDIKSKKWKQEKTEGKTVKEVENEIVSETGCESINDELIDMTATINDNLLQSEINGSAPTNLPLKLLPKPFKCMFCLFNATQFKLLQHHLLKHSNEKRFNCEVCEFTTTNFKSFMKHLKLHSGVKLYECNFCEYVSIYNSSLKKHIRRHTGERPFSCMFCDYTCLQSAHLQAHVRTHTGEKPFKCEFCDYSCAVSGALAKHIKLHTKEKLYVCTVCGNSFSQSGSLKRHKLLHDKFKTYFSSGKKPFSCTYCDYTCLQMGTLKRHLRSHTGEKPYTCIFCERSFASSDTLKRHIRVHTEEKPYSCKLCEFTSSSSGSLSDHVKTHTGEKPFGCKICGYLCIRSATLTRHMRRHTGEKPYKCHLCKHAFVESGALKKHLRKHEVAQE